MSHLNSDIYCKFAIKEDKMIVNTEVPTAIIFYLKKIFSSELGYALMTLPFAITIPEGLKVIFQGTEYRDMYVIVFVFLICFLLFCFVFAIDFITGFNASKKKALEKKKTKFIKSGRLWSSFWKLAAFFTISFPLFGFIFVFYLLDMDFVYYLLLSITVIFMLLACFVEIFSIGENLEKTYGYKPKYFIYFDLISKSFEKLFRKNLDNLSNK